jgi:hypothetical protein
MHVLPVQIQPFSVQRHAGVVQALPLLELVLEPLLDPVLEPLLELPLLDPPLLDPLLLLLLSCTKVTCASTHCGLSPSPPQVVELCAQTWTHVAMI